MLSPLSASTALTMLLNGCGEDTFTQLHGTLKYPVGVTISDINKAYKSLVDQLLKADPKVKFALANAIFYRNGFVVKPQFLATMSNDYKATVEGLDFAALIAGMHGQDSRTDNLHGQCACLHVVQ